MSEHEFQREVLSRLARLETMQEERYRVWDRVLDTLQTRVGGLEAAEQRRRGGIAVMAALWAAAGVLGALVERILNMSGRWQ